MFLHLILEFLLNCQSYFPYSRQSKKKSHRGAITARMLANLLSVAGIHHVITVDLHVSTMDILVRILRTNLIGPANARFLRKASGQPPRGTAHRTMDSKSCPRMERRGGSQQKSRGHKAGHVAGRRSQAKLRSCHHGSPTNPQKWNEWKYNAGRKWLSRELGRRGIWDRS